jgi:hypothetical protein
MPYAQRSIGRESGPATALPLNGDESMWPYNQDEVAWLVEPRDAAVAERARSAAARKWLRDMGVTQAPANDEPAMAISMIDPRR